MKALRGGRRLRRQARREGRRTRTHQCPACGVFVYAFPRVAQPGGTGLPPLSAFMDLPELHGERSVRRTTSVSENALARRGLAPNVKALSPQDKDRRPNGS